MDRYTLMQNDCQSVNKSVASAKLDPDISTDKPVIDLKANGGTISMMAMRIKEIVTGSCGKSHIDATMHWPRVEPRAELPTIKLRHISLDDCVCDPDSTWSS
jgi:hypothetical protein